MGAEADVPTTLSVMEHALFPESPPPTLGRFEIVRQLGRGGMGVVYLARDPELKRDVAIKVHGRGADAIARARMRREAEALARLRHRNVVTVHEVGLSEGGDVFVVMEHLAGPTLTTWIADEPRPVRRIVEVMARCARGLAAAHEAGLVHRDFKPANVVLDEDGEPKIVDFGLARAGSDTAGGDTHDAIADDSLTHDGALAGTPRYMAPELWRGDPPSAGADQFAFCVALYELLAGQPPYEPRRFDAAPRRPMRGHGALWSVLRRGLDPDARARFATMRALADRLDAAVDPGLSRPVMLAGIGATAIAVGTAVAFLGGDRSAEPSDATTAMGTANDVAACPIGTELLAARMEWTGDTGAIGRGADELRLTSGAAPAAEFVSAALAGPAMSFHDRSLELEVVAAPSRGEDHELIFGLKDDADVFMAGILVMGGRWAFPLAPGLRELDIEIGPRDRFFRMQVQATPGAPETVTFEASQDREDWRPIARTHARVGPGRPFVTLGSRSDMQRGDAAVVRDMRCDALRPVAEIPYDRDLSRPRISEAEPAEAQGPAPAR